MVWQDVLGPASTWLYVTVLCWLKLNVTLLDSLVARCPSAICQEFGASLECRRFVRLGKRVVAWYRGAGSLSGASGLLGGFRRSERVRLPFCCAGEFGGEFVY